MPWNELCEMLISRNDMGGWLSAARPAGGREGAVSCPHVQVSLFTRFFGFYQHWLRLPWWSTKSLQIDHIIHNKVVSCCVGSCLQGCSRCWMLPGWMKVFTPSLSQLWTIWVSTCLRSAGHLQHKHLYPRAWRLTPSLTWKYLEVKKIFFLNAQVTWLWPVAFRVAARFHRKRGCDFTEDLDMPPTDMLIRPQLIS